MPAWLISIGKWVIVTFVVPAIHGWVKQWRKLKERAKRLAEKVKINKHKEESYEKDPSDSNFSDLP